MKVSNVLLLGAVSIVVAGQEMDMHGGMGAGEGGAGAHASQTVTSDLSHVTPVPHEVGHMHGMPILETHLTPAERLYWESYNTTTFFSTDKGNRSAFWYHVTTLAIAAFFTYPICLALNNIDSGWYLPMLTVHNFVIISSLVSLKIFDSSFPVTWYANNAYRKMSYILFVFSLVHFVSALIVRTSKWIAGHGYNREVSFELNDYAGDSGFSPLTSDYDESTQNRDEPLQSLQSPRTPPLNKNTSEDHYDPRNSLGSPTTTLFDAHVKHHDDLRSNKYRDDSNSFDINDENFAKDLEERIMDSEGYQLRHQSKTSMKRDNYLAKIFNNHMLQSVAMKFSSLFSIIFHCTNYPVFLYYFVYVPTGLAVGSLLGQGNKVFNLLAHWIKGGVFLSLGVLSLARYCGFGSNNGWAWNKIVIFKNQVDVNSFYFRWMPQGGITMEGFESFLICFYGCTNVFLEHLSNPHGAWAAKDLQHVSIAFMFIGCGFCGLLAEIKLSDWRFNHVLKHTNIDPDAIHSGFPGYSPNPFPAFTIFWTGILMSQHAQASQTSTTIHVQWGNLLSYGSFFRIFTFVLLMLVPNQNLNPSRPLTELITSFCLICGGLVFMESTDQVIEAIEYRGFTPMFTFNLSVGFVTIFMAWEMGIFMWKDWLKERKNKR